MLQNANKARISLPETEKKIFSIDEWGGPYGQMKIFSFSSSSFWTELSSRMYVDHFVGKIFFSGQKTSFNHFLFSSLRRWEIFFFFTSQLLRASIIGFSIICGEIAFFHFCWTSSGQNCTLNIMDATQKCENRRTSENTLFCYFNREPKWSWQEQELW